MHAMRYRLRTLLIVLAILPPLLWFSWTKYEAWRAERERLRALREFQAQVQQLGSGIIVIGGVKSPTVPVQADENRSPRPIP